MDILERCAVCQGMLDEEDLFCANCGTETPFRDEQPASDSHLLQHNFVCSGCGASMSYDASVQTLRCPFCGSDDLEGRQDVKALAPQAIVPFSVRQDQAQQTLRRWMGSSFWRPKDLSQAAKVVKMTPVYVPYWVFSASTSTYWNADTNRTPPGARADWYPVHGEHQAHYRGVLVGASGALTAQETSALCPFDLQAGVPPSSVDTDQAIYEPFTVQRKYARPLARQAFEQLERAACEQLVPGRSRNLKLNVRLERLGSEPVLLPVWIMAYRYREEVYRVLVNGQTGKLYGMAPFDWSKLWWILGFAAVAIGSIGLISMLANR